MKPHVIQDLLPLCRTLPGVRQDQDLLTIPPEGGGLLLPDFGEAPGRWINCAFILEETHAQAFEFRFYAEEEAPRVIVRFGIMPGWTARFALDLRWLDGHCLFPGHRAGTQKVVCHGSRIALSEIRRAELVAMPSAEPVHVRICALDLAEAPCDPSHLPDTPMIDSFGQYIPKEWPGKIKSEEELKKVLAGEAAKKPVWHGSSWTVWGGDARLPLTEGFGFFGKIFHDGRWYLTDPSGCAFFSLGPDCVVVRCDARIDGLQSLLEDPADRRTAPSSPLCESMTRVFGETPRPNGLMFSYERKNLIRAFGAEWESAWRKMIVSQLMNLGLNTLGNWSDPALFGTIPYVTSLREFPATAHCIFRDFPDVLSDEYRQNALRCAQTLKDRANDPWMIGYFLRNEPAWAFVDDLIIADEVLRDPETTACKAGLIDFLSSRYETAECLSSAWNHAFSSFDDLYTPLENASSLSARAREDLREYSAFLIRQYVEIPTACCRAVDPNHMILGMRWAWISDPLLVSGWDCFDVFSINCYAVDPTPALDHVRDLGVNLPVMIGEFHFGALDAGLPATGLEAVANQEERAKAFRFYCERVAAHPFGVGCHWFQCYDQFALGRFDGENYQIGLFDITLRPYPLMEQAAHLTADRIYRVKAGEEQPFSSRPVSLPMIAY